MDKENQTEQEAVMLRVPAPLSMKLQKGQLSIELTEDGFAQLFEHMIQLKEDKLQHA